MFFQKLQYWENHILVIEHFTQFLALKPLGNRFVPWCGRVSVEVCGDSLFKGWAKGGRWMGGAVSEVFCFNCGGRLDVFRIGRAGHRRGCRECRCVMSVDVHEYIWWKREKERQILMQFRTQSRKSNCLDNKALWGAILGPTLTGSLSCLVAWALRETLVSYGACLCWNQQAD